MATILVKWRTEWLPKRPHGRDPRGIARIITFQGVRSLRMPTSKERQDHFQHGRAQDRDLGQQGPREAEVHGRAAAAGGQRPPHTYGEEAPHFLPKSLSWDDLVLPNRSWWETLPWEAVVRVGWPTFVQVPDRFRGALIAARSALLDALAAADGRGDTEPEWKALLLFDSLPFPGPPGLRGDLFGVPRGAVGVVSGRSMGRAVGRRRWPRSAAKDGSHQESDERKAARVHTLAATGEEGRALQAMHGAPPAPRTAHTLQRLRANFPDTALPPTAAPGALAGAPPSDDTRERVREEVAKLLRRHPRLTAPRLLGARLVHLATTADDP